MLKSGFLGGRAYWVKERGLRGSIYKVSSSFRALFEWYLTQRVHQSVYAPS